VNARKERLGEREALELLTGIDQIYSTRGRKVVHVDLRRERPPRAELLGLLLGPSGRLRAPAVRRGGVLVVGFDEGTYGDLIGNA
jgi:hypothetical protein